MKRGGFSLFELLIVMVIISALAAILFPIYARGRNKSREATCLFHLRQLGLVLQIYSQNWEGHLPPKKDDLSPLAETYVPREILFCPQDLWIRQNAELFDESAHISDTANSSYYYRAGLTTYDLASEVVAFDKGAWHGKGRNIMLLDASAKWIAKKDLDEIPVIRQRLAHEDASSYPWQQRGDSK